MKLLLDTHIFIWWDSQPNKLSSSALTELHNSSNEIFLSVTSIWEMQIKSQLGKLILRQSLPQLIKDQEQVNGLRLLSVEANHVFALDGLPFHHKDPFDRLLIAQAGVENMTILSMDSVFPLYGVSLIQ